MPNPFVRRLRSVAPLPQEDIDLLNSFLADQFMAPARTDLICEGESPNFVHLIVSGYAGRCKYRSDGKRQIVSYLVPGDLCDAHVRILGRMDHTISTLTECRIVRITFDHMERMMARPALARAMWWSTLVEESILREWLASVGGQSAKGRLGHLFCELYVRLRAVGLADDHHFTLPLTQQELGETVGLSTVHVNRAMKALREERLIALHHKELKILDPKRLVETAGFNADYLHFGIARQQVPSTHSELDAGPDHRGGVARP